MKTKTLLIGGGVAAAVVLYMLYTRAQAAQAAAAIAAQPAVPSSDASADDTSGDATLSTNPMGQGGTMPPQIAYPAPGGGSPMMLSAGGGSNFRPGRFMRNHPVFAQKHPHFARRVRGGGQGGGYAQQGGQQGGGSPMDDYYAAMAGDQGDGGGF